jgi:hypothetical protein
MNSKYDQDLNYLKRSFYDWSQLYVAIAAAFALSNEDWYLEPKI